MPIDKTHIIEEIRRTAAENGGVPLGKQRFFAETGIKQSDWLGVHWVRWSEALFEAGFAPNELSKAIGKDQLIQKYADLAKELGRLPVSGDLRMRARKDRSFPSHTVFARIGMKLEIV